MTITESELIRGYALDSLALNATLAALDERSSRLHSEWVRLLGEPPSQSRDFALECNADAIRYTDRARLAFARQMPDGEMPDPGDAYKAGLDRGIGYHDVQAER